MFERVERAYCEALLRYVDALEASVLMWDIYNQEAAAAETIRNRSHPQRIDGETGYHCYDDSSHEQKALTGKLASKGATHEPPFRLHCQIPFRTPLQM
jgi:hypothetical protein